MKKYIGITIISIILFGCGSSGNGELVGVQKRSVWNPTTPYGMVYVPQGSYVMGPSDQDVPFQNVSQSKTVSVGAFYMDETEITNNEYRQFTNWVRDSILRKQLANDYPEEYAMYDKDDLTMEDRYGENRIDWNKKIRWDDEEVRSVLDEVMYLPEHERLDARKEFNTRKYIYKYQVLDIGEASKKSNRGKTRDNFLDTISVHIYPDTMTWDHDYSYSFNDPYSRNYFWHQ